MMEKYGVETKEILVNQKTANSKDNEFIIGKYYCSKCGSDLELSTNYCFFCKEVPLNISARVETSTPE